MIFLFLLLESIRPESGCLKFNQSTCGWFGICTEYEEKTENEMVSIERHFHSFIHTETKEENIKHSVDPRDMLQNLYSMKDQYMKQPRLLDSFARKEHSLLEVD